MKNEEVQIILNKKIKNCKKEHTKQNIDTLLKLGCTVLGFEGVLYLFERQLHLLEVPVYITGALLAYAANTVDEPLSFQYNKKEYLDFLKEVRNEIQTNRDKYENVKEEEFDKELYFEYELKKVNN